MGFPFRTKDLMVTSRAVLTDLTNRWSHSMIVEIFSGKINILYMHIHIYFTNKNLNHFENSNANTSSLRNVINLIALLLEVTLLLNSANSL